MTAPTALRTMRKSLLPGDCTYVDTQGNRGKFEPAHIVDGRVMQMEKELVRFEDRIGATFMADLFLMMAQTSIPNMTAREVEERHEEKMLQLGPPLERIQGEALKPLIDRTFLVMLRGGQLPEVPEELIGLDLRVEYISLLAAAQKMISTVGVERLLSFVATLDPIYPEAKDKVDIDRTMDEYADLLGVNPELMRPQDEVERLREERAQFLTSDAAGAAKDITQAGKNVADMTAAGGPSPQDMAAAYDQGFEEAA